MISHEVHRPSGAFDPSPKGGHGTTAASKRSMWPLYAILLVALAPVVAALLAYFVPQLGLRPEGHVNYGRILEPQRPMPSAQELPLTTLNGEAFDLESLQGKWLLISADSAACPESCVRKLFILRNSHASQGKNVERLARVWFVTDQGEVPQTVLDAYVGTHMLRADSQALANFLSADRQGPQAIDALHRHMWIIDPLGNLMMEFPPEADPIAVRDDIVKLLKRSRIG